MPIICDNRIITFPKKWNQSGNTPVHRIPITIPCRDSIGSLISAFYTAGCKEQCHKIAHPTAVLHVFMLVLAEFSLIQIVLHCFSHQFRGNNTQVRRFIFLPRKDNWFSS